MEERQLWSALSKTQRREIDTIRGETAAYKGLWWAGLVGMALFIVWLA